MTAEDLLEKVGKLMASDDRESALDAIHDYRRDSIREAAALGKEVTPGDSFKTFVGVLARKRRKVEVVIRAVDKTDARNRLAARGYNAEKFDVEVYEVYK